jgi:hypothetical protein
MVDKLFVGISSQSLPATGQRTAYVAVTRAKEQAVICTDDRKELLKAVSRPDDPISATELTQPPPEQTTPKGRMKKLAFPRHGGGCVRRGKPRKRLQSESRSCDSRCK